VDTGLLGERKGDKWFYATERRQLAQSMQCAVAGWVSESR